MDFYLVLGTQKNLIRSTPTRAAESSLRSGCVPDASVRISHLLATATTAMRVHCGRLIAEQNVDSVTSY